jgi:hypothetical protein
MVHTGSLRTPASPSVPDTFQVFLRAAYSTILKKEAAGSFDNVGNYPTDCRVSHIRQ